MTILQRAAGLAAMTFLLVGAAATSAPGLATELDRTAIVSSSTLPNGLTAGTVPSPTLQPALVDQALAASDDTVTAAEPDVDEDELRCLAGAVYFESKGEPLAGQQAVAQVIVNRTRSGRFPADVCGVVKQRGQFSFVRGGEIPTIDAGRPAWRTAVAIARVALTEAWEGDAPGALFFHARGVAAGGRFVRVASIGNHIFYR